MFEMESDKIHIITWNNTTWSLSYIYLNILLWIFSLIQGEQGEEEHEQEDAQSEDEPQEEDQEQVGYQTW